MSDSNWGSWAEDREHKYVVGLRVSAAERLAWVEAMLAVAFASGALPKPRDEWGQSIAPARAGLL